MSCLTRELQQHLTRYLKSHPALLKCPSCPELKARLVGQGLCIIRQFRIPA